MQLAALEIVVAVLVISGIQRGVIPSGEDWQRFIVSASRLQLLAQEYQA